MSLKVHEYLLKIVIYKKINVISETNRIGMKREQQNTFDLAVYIYFFLVFLT